MTSTDSYSMGSVAATRDTIVCHMTCHKSVHEITGSKMNVYIHTTVYCRWTWQMQKILHRPHIGDPKIQNYSSEVGNEPESRDGIPRVKFLDQRNIFIGEQLVS